MWYSKVLLIFDSRFTHHSLCPRSWRLVRGSQRTFDTASSVCFFLNAVSWMMNNKSCTIKFGLFMTNISWFDYLKTDGIHQQTCRSSRHHGSDYSHRLSWLASLILFLHSIYKLSNCALGLKNSILWCEHHSMLNMKTFSLMLKLVYSIFHLSTDHNPIWATL